MMNSEAEAHIADTLNLRRLLAKMKPSDKLLLPGRKRPQETSFHHSFVVFQPCILALSLEWYTGT